MPGVENLNADADPGPRRRPTAAAPRPLPRHLPTASGLNLPTSALPAGHVEHEHHAARAALRARATPADGWLEWLLEGAGWTWLRLLVDATMLSVAVVVAVRWPHEPITMEAASTWPLAVFPPAVMGMLALRGMYARSLRVSIIDGVAPVISGISFGAMALVSAELYVFSQPLQTAVLVHLWGTAVVGVGAGRVAVATAQRTARVRALVGRPALIVGAGLIGGRVARRLQENPDYGLRPIGFLDAAPPAEGRVAGLPVLGHPSDVDWIASLSGARHVVLTFIQAPDQELVEFAKRCNELALEVSVVPRLFEAVNDRFSYEAIGGLPLLALHQTRPRGRGFATKHLFDRAMAAVAILLFAPILLVIAAAVQLNSRGPVFFRQCRVGRDGQEFDLMKFRSMEPMSDEDGFRPDPDSAPGGVEGSDRRTAVGRFLRRTSLDELPQLFNVARGEMSLVGPRPERPEFVEVFARDVTRYGERHRVKSGITGWAQVHGLRGQTSLSDRIEWDNYYIEHWSWKLDLKILALTVVAVLRPAE